MVGLALLRRFLRCRKGITALEFALVAPALLLILTGTIDLMLVMFVSALMEGGVRDGARLGRTGFQPAGSTREEAIMQKVADATLGLIDMSQVHITTMVYNSFGAIGQPEPFTDTNSNMQYDAGEPWDDVNGNGVWDADQGAPGAGGSSSVVLYKVTYDWTLLTPLLPRLLVHGDTIALEASVAVRNEPWNSPPPPLPSS